MMDAELFRRIAGHWLTGVAVVTSVLEDEPCGMTVNAVTSLSLDPPQFLVCLDRRTKTLAAIRASENFCINYLSEHQEHVSTVFARRGGDKFAALKYGSGRTGSPVLEGVIAHVECKLHEVLPGGDHDIVIGDAVFGSARGGDPLGYFAGSYRRIKS